MKKKKKVAILSSTLLATVLVTSPVSASSTTLEDSIKDFDYETVINTYYSSIPEEVKNIKGDTKKEFNKEFLTDEEINQITPDIIKSVYNKIEENPRFNSFNDLGTNKLVADLFRDEIKNSESGIGLNWSLPGYDNLTDEEKKLAKSHPLEFAKYADAALYATSVAEDYYAPSELYQGNGDAFRHSFWNAIMIKRFNGTLSDRVERVHIWTDAHESESSGVDKEMDLINNEIGRYYGYLNYTKSNQYIIDGLRENVRNRGLVRIVNGELVATNAWNGWVWE